MIHPAESREGDGNTEVEGMEALGRWFGIALCILQLTVLPANELQKSYIKEVKAYLIDLTEQFFCKVRREGAITLEGLEEYEAAFEALCGRFSFEIKYGREYYLPAAAAGYDSAALPMHIYYSAQIRDELAENGQILLGEGNVFQICIRERRAPGFGAGPQGVNTGDSVVYICGGELS